MELENGNVESENGRQTRLVYEEEGRPILVQALVLCVLIGVVLSVL